jgi:NADH:ubiquinone oxidoreductase subunit 5 (subunit L)/multisubunit Na+/H+ antiporter MnhA subunit
MLINRVGDFFSIVAIVIIFVNFKDIDFFNLAALVHVYSKKVLISSTLFGEIFVIDFICILLTIGAITKSAQIGLHG